MQARDALGAVFGARESNGHVAALLNELAAKTRILKSVLLREAVDDLLVKYKVLKSSKAKT